MKTITRKWRKWFAIPLVIVLALSIALPLQLSRAPTPVYASGVNATNVILTDQVLGNYTNVQFDIGWEYSWRDMVNWDAAWVFVKYKVGGNPWAHATLDTADHTAPTGSTITAAADGTGVFIYRDAAGTGTVYAPMC